MKIRDLDKLVAELRQEFGVRVDRAEINVVIQGMTPDNGKLRWKFDVSDLCVDRLYVWLEDECAT